MLNELQRLHSEILQHIEDLDMLTAEDQPSIVELTGCRLALVRASRARRALLDRIYEDLTPSADTELKMALANLRAENLKNQRRAAAYIGQWALQDVRERWNVYCDASLRYRSEMRKQVAAEKRVIYPLLRDSV